MLCAKIIFITFVSAICQYEIINPTQLFREVGQNIGLVWKQISPKQPILKPFATRNCRGFLVRLMQTREGLIQDAIDDKWIKSLAFSVYVKARYSNATIFDFSSRKAGIKLKMSHEAVNYHIRELEKRGLIRRMNKNGKVNITFIKTSQKHKCTLDITKQDSLKDIEHKLMFKIVEQHHRQQSYMISLKSEARTTCRKKFPTKHEIKRCNEILSLSPVKRKIDFRITFTDKKLAQMMNVSEKTAQVLKKAWKKLGYLNYFAPLKAIGKANNKCKEYLKQGQFYSKGYIWEQSATQYKILTGYSNETASREEGKLVDTLKTQMDFVSTLMKFAQRKYKATAH